MNLLLVASDAMEFRGLVKHCTQVRACGLPLDWARRARLGAYEVLLAANGVGARRAAAAVDAAAGNFAPDGIVSLGFCGALDPALQVADIVTGSCVTHHHQAHTAMPVSCGRAHRTGAVCSLDSIARTAGEKSALFASGAVAVEMEAGGVAQQAQALGKPFYCIKAVTDLADETMQNDFNQALRSDGHFDTIKLLASSLRHPSVRIPELLRLRKRSLWAAEVLGEFVADSRF